MRWCVASWAIFAALQLRWLLGAVAVSDANTGVASSGGGASTGGGSSGSGSTGIGDDTISFSPVPGGTSYPTASPYCSLCGYFGGDPSPTNNNLPIADGGTTTCGDVQTLVSSFFRYDASCQLIQTSSIPARCGCPTPPPTMAPTSYPACSVCSGTQQITLPEAIVNEPVVSSLALPFTCSDVNFYGSVGYINPSNCSRLSQIGASTICGCQTISPGTTDCQAAPTLTLRQSVLASIPNTTTASVTRSRFCGVSIDSPGVWFKYVGTGGLVTASTCGYANFDAKVSVFTGTDCNALTCIGGNEYYCGSRSSYTWLAASGTTYLILVHKHYYDSAGEFNLTVSDDTPPPTVAPTPFPTSVPTSICYVCDQYNQRVTQLDTVVDNIPGQAPTTCSDLEVQGLSGELSSSVCSTLSQQGVSATCGCATLDNLICDRATPISSGQTVFGSNLNGTTSRNNITFCGTSIDGRGVWYSYTATTLGRVTASTCLESSLLLDTKISVFSGSCNQLVCIGGNDDSCGFQSKLSWVVTAGTKYFILIHGFGGSVGNFALTVDEIPLASVDTSAPTPAPTFSPTVGRYPDCNICGDTSQRVSLPNTPIAPSSYQTCGSVEYNGLTGLVETRVCSILQELDLTSTCACITPTGNDACQGAITIGLGSNINGTTNNTTFDNAAICDVYNQGPGVWFRVVGTGGPVEADTCKFSETGMTIAVFSGSCDALTCVGGNSYFCGQGARVTWNSQAGQVYYILVSSAYSSGKFTLTVAPVTPPANDVCSNAASISSGDVVSATTNDATADSTVGACGQDVNNTLSRGVWYKVTSNGDPTRYIADTCSFLTNYETAISVFTGSCNQLVCVAGNVHGCGYKSRVRWVSDTAQDFYILVHGFGSNQTSNDFQLELTEIPATPTASPAPTVTYFPPHFFFYEGDGPAKGGVGGGGSSSGGGGNRPPSIFPPVGFSAGPPNSATDAPVSPEKPPVISPAPVVITAGSPEATPATTSPVATVSNRTPKGKGSISGGGKTKRGTQSPVAPTTSGSKKRSSETKGAKF